MHIETCSVNHDSESENGNKSSTNRKHNIIYNHTQNRNHNYNHRYSNELSLNRGCMSLFVINADDIVYYVFFYLRPSLCLLARYFRLYNKKLALIT